MDNADRPKVGIKDVSKEAGVALSTVSHVLNGTASISPEVRSRVLEAARRLGYLAKRQQKGSIASLSTVYLAVPPGNIPHVETNLFSWTLLTALTRECERRGVRVVAHPSGETLNAQQIIDGAKAASAEGIVLVYDDDPKLLRALSASGIALVLLNGEDPSMSVDTVTPGNRYAARLATEWLLSRGHRKILHLTWRGRGTITPRVDGFNDAYRERNLPLDLGKVHIADGYQPSDGEAAIRSLLAASDCLEGITAIFCASDNLAVGTLRALEANGKRVPDDFAVVGFDGVALGDLTQPPLTTVRVPLQEMAILALQSLENRISLFGFDHPPCRIELGCKLIERESAKALQPTK